MLVYKSVLENENSGGGDGSSIKDAYRNKVFGDMTDLTYREMSTYSGRSSVREARYVVDPTTTTVWVYADFDIITSLNGGDWYGVLEFPGFSKSWLPQTETTDRVHTVLTTDPLSANPANSFFVKYYSSGTRICIHEGDRASANTHYILYGSWQY